MFGLCQILTFVEYVRSRLSQHYFDVLFRSVMLIVGVTVGAVGAVLMATGSILLHRDFRVLELLTKIKDFVFLNQLFCSYL